MNNMATALISAGGSVLVGMLTLIGVVITNNKSNRDMQSNLQTVQAVTETKIEELTREVRLHNDFAHRVPILEEQMKVTNHRLNDLEKERR